MRFSLRRMFLITAICAVAIALLLWSTENYRRQRAIRADLISHGAAWGGFSSIEPDCKPNLMFNQPITFDFQNYESLKIVELKGYKVRDSCLKHLSKLRQIDRLYFISCKLDAHLDSLTSTTVTQLLFWNVDLTDESVDSIARIPGLKTVILKSTLVTPDGADRLRASLPEVDIILRP